MTTPAPATPAAPATPDPKAAATPPVAATGTPKPGETLPVKPAADPVAEFKPLEVVVDGKKLIIQTHEQLTRALQKAMYADQEIKNAAQAIKGVEALKAKLKTKEGLREVLSDPEIGVDVKQMAIEYVREAMDEEKLTPEQRESKKYKTEADQLRKEKEDREAQAKLDDKKKEVQAKAVEFRKEIIESMQAHPDLPQDQETMDACIQIMRAAYRRFEKVLPAAKAMEIVEKRYFDRLSSSVKAWPAEKILERFGKEVLDKMQQLELQKLKDGTKPKGGSPPAAPAATSGKKKKDHLTEKEWEALVNQRVAGL